MPEKSVREMNKYERLHYSLASRTFHAVLIGAIILGLVSLLVGLGLYAIALSGQYIGEAFEVSKNARAIIDKVADIAPMAEETMKIYSSMTDAERAEVGEDNYYARFSSVENSENYTQVRSILKDFSESSDVDDVYFGMYDEKTGKLVFIVDPDDRTEDIYRAGDYEDVSQKEIEKFLNWNGEGRLYHITKTESDGWLCTSGYPVMNSEGKPVGFILADVTLGNVANGMKNFVLQYAIAMVAVVNLLAIFLTQHMKKALVKPINAIAEAAGKYVADRRLGKKDTGHFSSLNISTGDEVENLALIMADMEKDLSDFEDSLTQVTAEKERIGTELALATRIQADMLPNIYPAFPDRADFDIYAKMTPAKEVGGDFYDFFLIDDDHLGIVMADVSGKGIPAALFMMVCKILVQNVALTGKSPAEVLETVNEQICKNNHEEMFVTVWLGILDLKTGKIAAANAGHEYPILKNPNGDFEVIKDKHGFVIGGMDGIRYKNYELTLEPGSKLFVYTDGVAEATNAQKELFGMDRTVEALNKAKNDEPVKILQSVSDAVELFVGDAPQFDDLTMLCVHYIGEQASNAKEITLDATVENITTVTEFIDAELEAIDCPMKAQMQIDVAIDELFGNIAQYAYAPGTGKATVRFETGREQKNVTITFIDEGKQYDPLAKEDPDTTLSAEERKIGGLGVFLVKKTMDDVKYRYKDGKNILKIKKIIK
ncbi:MAG: SpoIIE family protein phosphatase [Clostridia bacterium]|nr:SpoIIE family protein phosphatase [Clostridia bacterium]